MFTVFACNPTTFYLVSYMCMVNIVILDFKLVVITWVVSIGYSNCN